MAISKGSTLVAPRSDDDLMPGRAYPPGRSVALDLHLRVRGRTVELVDAAGEVWRHVARTDLSVDAPLGRLDRKVTFPDGTVFETSAAEAFDRALGPHKAAMLHKAEAFHPRLIAVILASLLGAFAIWRLALPVLVAVAVWLTPDGLRRQIDTGQMAVMDRLLLDPTTLSEARQAEIAAIYADLADAVPEGDLPSRTLLFRASGIGPNAFALPGGTIVVIDDLARMLEDDPDAMAGVLAHELTHVTEQHGLRALYRALAIAVLVALVVGDTGPILEEAVLEGNILLALAGSRAAELEADAGGVALMQLAGYDPEGLARFFDRLSLFMGDGGGWMSTHPGSGDRAQAIRDLAR
ncbi:MAG: M48 family metallopeptidase [Pseudomonadota bacterium]